MHFDFEMYCGFLQEMPRTTQSLTIVTASDGDLAIDKMFNTQEA